MIEEIHRHEPEATGVRRHARPFFAVGNMRQPYHIPQHNVTVIDGAIRLRPQPQAGISRVEVGIVTRTVQPVRLIRRDPQVMVYKSCPASNPRLGMGFPARRRH